MDKKVSRRQILLGITGAGLAAAGIIKLTDGVHIRQESNFLVVEKRVKKWPRVEINTGDAWLRVEGYDQQGKGPAYPISEGILRFPHAYWAGMNPKVPAIVTYKGMKYIHHYKPQYAFKYKGFEAYSDEELPDIYREQIIRYADTMQAIAHLFYTYVYYHNPNPINLFAFWEEDRRVDITLGQPYSEIGAWHELAHRLFEALDHKQQKEAWRVLFSLSPEEIEAIDESNSLKLEDNIGHPHDNASEMFASALTTLRFSKDLASLRVAERIAYQIIGTKGMDKLL